MKQFITNRPIVFAIGISLFDLALGLLVFIIGSALGLSEQTLEWVALSVTTALPLILIGWLGWWRDAGFVSTTQNNYALARLQDRLPLPSYFWLGSAQSKYRLD